jgi:hypothetical protein
MSRFVSSQLISSSRTAGCNTSFFEPSSVMAEKNSRFDHGSCQVDPYANNVDTIERLYWQCKRRLDSTLSALSTDPSMSDSNKTLFENRTKGFALWTWTLAAQLHCKVPDGFDYELARRLSVNTYIFNFLVHILENILFSLNKYTAAGDISEMLDDLKFNIALLNGLINVLSNQRLIHQKYKIKLGTNDNSAAFTTQFYVFNLARDIICLHGSVIS